MLLGNEKEKESRANTQWRSHRMTSLGETMAKARHHKIRASTGTFCAGWEIKERMPKLSRTFVSIAVTSHEAVFPSPDQAVGLLQTTPSVVAEIQYTKLRMSPKGLE